LAGRAMKATGRYLFLAALVALVVLAGPGPAGQAGSGEDLEIGGLILSRMQTPLGHDFYCYFCSYFSPPSGVGSYNIVIKERASAQWGSWIWVEVNEAVVYRVLLSPRRGDVERVAKDAVARTLRYLLQAKLRIDDDGLEDLASDGY